MTTLQTNEDLLTEFYGRKHRQRNRTVVLLVALLVIVMVFVLLTVFLYNQTIIQQSTIEQLLTTRCNAGPAAFRHC